MKKSQLLLLAASLAVASVAQAANYDVDPSHSSVGFNIRHMVGKVNGLFTDFSGNFSFDDKKPTASSVVNTQNEKRDKHLQSPDFFDVEKFPAMTFKSRKVVAAGKDKYKVIGDLTLHGVTKEETFVIEYGGTVKDPWGNQRSGFSASTTLNRKDFGIIWNKTLDAGSLMLGEDVNVSLQIEAIQKSDAPKKM